VLASRKITILSLDPGTKNYGYSVIEFDASSKIRLKKAGRLFSTIHKLNQDLMSQISEYSSAIHRLIDEHSVRLIIAERYMSRRMGGTTIECVNAMLGVLMEICESRGLRLKLIPASQWKNDVERQREGQLPELYQEGKANKITPHTIDAVMIGLYGRSSALGINAFKGVRTEGFINALLKTGIEDIGSPIVNIKKKRKRRAKN
jgi:Holliday junction resolvasome RuvABC endonuclease subunit